MKCKLRYLTEVYCPIFTHAVFLIHVCCHYKNADSGTFASFPRSRTGAKKIRFSSGGLKTRPGGAAQKRGGVDESTYPVSSCFWNGFSWFRVSISIIFLGCFDRRRLVCSQDSGKDYLHLRHTKLLTVAAKCS